MGTELPARSDAPPTLADFGGIECSYSLRGLPADGRCPECGTPVARSAGIESHLRKAAPAVRRGVWFGLACVVSPLSGPVVQGLAANIKFSPLIREWSL